MEPLKVMMAALPVAGWAAPTRMERLAVEEKSVEALSQPLRHLSIQPMSWNRRS